MAKSEQAVNETDAMDGEAFDVEALLEEDLRDLPETPTLTGFWRVQWISSGVFGGQGPKGPWSKVNIQFDAIEPVGEGAEDIEPLSEPVRFSHQRFYSKERDKKEFVDFVANFGVEAGKLREMLSDAKGEVAIARLSPATDYRGRKVTEAKGFRPNA